MRYLKLYENVVEDLIKKEESIRKEKLEMLKLIDNFVFINKDKWKMWKLNDYVKSFNFNIFNYDGEKYLFVEYHDHDGEEYDYDFSLKLNDFLEFCKDPEFYKNINKYNL